jgi:ABC-type multidrug transport system ATPase subunit
LILPICGIWILIAIKNATLKSTKSDGKSQLVGPLFPNDTQAKQILTFNDYMTALQVKKICVYEEKADRFFISGIVPFRWQVPLVRCDSRRCKFDGQDASTSFCQYKTIGLSGPPGRVFSFLSYLETRYPILAGSIGTSDSSGNNTSTILNFPTNYSIFRTFDSSQAMDAYVTAPDYLASKTKIAIGIAFNDDDDDNPNVYSYTIRPNSTHVSAAENIGRPGIATTPPPEKLFRPFAKQNNDSCPLREGTPYLGPDQGSCSQLYNFNGVLTIQRLVQDYILYDVQQKQSLTLLLNNNTTNFTYISEAGVQFIPFPTRRFKKDGVFTTLKTLGPLLITLGLLFPIATMTSYITQEKELRQKELMKMMSVAESDIGWSWFISFFLIHCTITSLLVAFVSAVLYNESSFLILWIFWIFTFISIIVVCMTIAAIFAKSLRGILISVLMFFVGSILAVAVPMETASTGWITFASIHPIATMAYGLEQVGMLEDKGVGLTFETFDLSLGAESGYSFRTTMLALSFDCVFWGFFSWYLNRVIKPEYGQALPFYFPFLPSYWCPPNSNTKPADDALVTAQPLEGIPYEPVSDALRRQSIDGESIELHNLRKQFGSQKIAVDGLSLSMYKGQITALLGHNGAGKTTTIGMLTGAIAPTDGYATITGQDIRTSMGSIRQNIGICLQHDCLFPMLTAREHLQFFARIKGLYRTSGSHGEAEESIDQSLRDVALFEKRDTFSKSLSGGMKRKLSVAIAFSGGSKIVVLDEPTSGMDPFSRRFTWNVIRQYRPDRCIILTTHFMDEADILGDRIAIMADGQLRCAGSSLFLKKTYGVGYQLTIEKGAEHAMQDETNPADKQQQQEEEQSKYTHGNEHIDTLVNDVVLKTVKDSALLNSSGLEMRYQLPMESSSAFPKMFQDLDSQIEHGTIQSYGIGMTTLDEVFLLVARGEIVTRDGSSIALGSSKKLLNDNNTPSTIRRADSLSERSKRTRMELEKEGLFVRHLTALTRKRAANFSRDKKAWCCTTLAPTICVLLSLILVKFTTPNRNLKPITLKMSDFNAGVTDGPTNPIWYNSPNNLFSCQPGRCAYDPPIYQLNETNEIYGYCGYLSRKLDPLKPKWSNNNSCTISFSELMTMVDGAQELNNATNLKNVSTKVACTIYQIQTIFYVISYKRKMSSSFIL